MQYRASKRATITSSRAASMALALVALLVLSGCSKKGGNGDEVPAGTMKTYERGPLTLEVHSSADTITTAETLTVTLSATTADTYSVEFPSYPEAEQPDTDAANGEGAAADHVFALVDTEESAPVLQADGKVTRSRRYQLEPFLAGAYTVPPLTVSFWEEQEGEDEKSAFDTEPIAVTVTSVLAPDAEPGMKAIAGPLAVRDPFPWIRTAVIVIVLLGIAAAIYWYWFRYTPPPPPAAPPVPPHVRAMEALEAIRRAKLVEQGMYKEYYIQVSDVLRRYMEEQFEVRAPERTTEEFLDDLQHNAILGLQEQLLLREFLRHCDLVKFARAEPTPEQISETMSTCEHFIIDSEAAYRASQKPAATAEA